MRNGIFDHVQYAGCAACLQFAVGIDGEIGAGGNGYGLLAGKASVAERYHQVGGVLGVDFAADVVDGGVDFVGADLGGLGGGKGVDTGGELSAQLQYFAAAMGGLPRLVAPAFVFKVVFG